MVAVPTPLDWIAFAGLSPSAAQYEAGVGDPLAFLLDPPRCSLRATAAQPIPNGAYTPVAFVGEPYDNEATAAHLSGTGMHDPATNNTRVVARTAGTYMCTGGVSWAGNGTGRRGIRWAKNGAALADSQVIEAATAAVAVAYAARTVWVPLSVGDYVELQAFQDVTGGGALNTDVTSPSGCDATVRWSGP